MLNSFVMSDIYAFTIIATLLVVSPGPNIALIIKSVSSNGRHAGFSNVFGFVIAAFCHGALAILGLSAIVLQSSQLFFVVKFIGAAYLFYIGLKAIYRSFDKEKPDSMSVEPSSENTSYKLKSFSDGFFTQMFNPKGSMFYLAAFPQFIDFQSSMYFEAFSLVAIHALLMVIWFSSVCVFVSNLKRLSHGGLVGKWIQRISGGILIMFSSLLITQEAKR